MALNAYVSITLSLIIRVFFTRQFKRPDVWVIVFIFGTPFWFNWIPFIRNSYGQSGIACWIKYNEIVNGTCQIFKFGQALELVLWYIPLYLMLGIMIILYTIVLVKFYFHRKQWVRFDQNKDNERRNAIKYVTSLLAYPLIYLLANVIPLISRFYSFTNPTNYPFILFLIAILFYTQQGTGIAIAVLVNLRKKLTYPSLKAALSGWCHREATVKEYPITEGEAELDDDDNDYGGPSESVSYKLYSDSKSSVVS